jgi:tRNA(Arg) A34 adenosine deaminase TadA
MRSRETDELDRKMMIRCIALSVRSGEEGEYPYGAVIRRANEILSESINRVAKEGDVTRHAEVVAISGAQKALGTVNLEDCVIYASAEPCAYCSYAIRESRLGASGLLASVTAYGGSFQVECTDRRRPVKHYARGIRAAPRNHCWLHGVRN